MNFLRPLIHNHMVAVALMSAAITTPSLHNIPTVVVPVFNIESSIQLHQESFTSIMLLVMKQVIIFKHFGL